MTRAIVSVAVIAVAAVAIVLGINSCDGPSKHKALCWQPSYAANPTATWPKHPSATHRHGTGARGVNVCGP